MANIVLKTLTIGFFLKILFQQLKQKRPLRFI